MKYDLLIFPYSGNGLEALDCLDDKYRLIGFIDDDRRKQGIQTNGFKVFSREAFEKYPKAKVLALPSSPSAFINIKKIISELKIEPKRFITLIHPKAHISKLAIIGINVVILAGTVITSNANIGNHVWIAANSIIHHDVVIKDYSTIGSSVLIAGRVKIEENCFIGSGSNIINDVVIGKKTLVGLGSNVICSIPRFSKVAGNPAKPI